MYLEKKKHKTDNKDKTSGVWWPMIIFMDSNLLIDLMWIGFKFFFICSLRINDSVLIKLVNKFIFSNFLLGVQS